jgi:filamentous hemagglutinin family protein
MFTQKNRLHLRSLIINTSFLCCSISYLAMPVKAQVTSDNTTSSNVEQAENITEITGGERANNNLFHSFEQFSIPDGTEAIFKNATDIENIFTRVTGDDISNIDGILSSQGDANFFFINPNGIIFGENAQLNVGGSFLASTAESIEFEDGSQFSATNNNEPLLTVSFPVGLGFGSSPGSIEVNGNTSDIPLSENNVSSGLSVQSNKTLALVGGDINISGGTINTSNGRIELGSLKSDFVNFLKTENGFAFEFDDVADINLKNIVLDNSSTLKVSGERNGFIKIHGSNLNILGKSLVSNNSSGQIFLEFANKIVLDDQSKIVSEASNSSEGGADIFIETTKLSINNAAQIASITDGQTNAGNIVIKGISISLQDAILTQEGVESSSILSRTVEGSSGNAGNIIINTEELKADGGAKIQNDSFSSGNVGNINISASKLIEFSGSLSLGSNGAISALDSGNSPSTISSVATSEGNSGRIQVSTSNLSFSDGASIFSANFGSGASALVDINSNKINFSGTTGSGEVPSGVFVSTGGLMDGGSVFVNTQQISINNGATISARTFGNAKGGDININSKDSLIVNNQGIITAESLSTGDAGELKLSADSISLDNNSEISASTLSGEGGNINLNTDSLKLFGQSNITASAGGQGNGGNVTIDTEVLTGLENSDITANAIAGNGGNINIKSSYIIGLESRSQLTPFSDITASSELGIDGTVTINSPETNAEEDVIVAAEDVQQISPEEIRAFPCVNRYNEKVRVRDVGYGIPQSPYNFSYDEGFNLDDLGVEQQASEIVAPTIVAWKPGEPIVEPNAIKTLPDGRQFFVAIESTSPLEVNLCTRDRN